MKSKQNIVQEETKVLKKENIVITVIIFITIKIIIIMIVFTLETLTINHYLVPTILLNSLLHQHKSQNSQIRNSII